MSRTPGGPDKVSPFGSFLLILSFAIQAMLYKAGLVGSLLVRKILLEIRHFGLK